MTVGTLLTVLSLLLGRAAAMCAGDVLLFLGFRLHLSFVGVMAFTTPAERNSIYQYILKITLLTHSRL